MKKTSVKIKEQSKLFGSVTVKTGSLGGITFTVDDHSPVINGHVRVKYAAPDHGPRTVVEHHAVRGEFDPARKAEDVRLAFTKLLPGIVLWSKENGYSDRKTGELLVWDRQLARFVTRKTKS